MFRFEFIIPKLNSQSLHLNEPFTTIIFVMGIQSFSIQLFILGFLQLRQAETHFHH